MCGTDGHSRLAHAVTACQCDHTTRVRQQVYDLTDFHASTNHRSPYGRGSTQVRLDWMDLQAYDRRAKNNHLTKIIISDMFLIKNIEEFFVKITLSVKTFY